VGRIRLRHGDNEIEVEGSDTFIKKQLEQFYARLGGSPAAGGKVPIREQLLSPGTPPRTGGKTPTPAEFYKEKGKTDGVSQILIFGKYLEEYRKKPEFTPKDVNAVAKEAKLSKDIHAQFFTNAVKQGLLRKQGQNYSLTLSAEELLAAK
jgi:hypothetical protein